MNPDPKKAIVIPMGAKKLPPALRKQEPKKEPVWVQHKSTFARDPWADVVRMCRSAGILTPE